MEGVAQGRVVVKAQVVPEPVNDQAAAIGAVASRIDRDGQATMMF